MVPNAQQANYKNDKDQMQSKQADKKRVKASVGF